VTELIGYAGVAARQQSTGRPGLRVLTLGGSLVDTATPMGSVVFTVAAALAQMELGRKQERIAELRRSH